MAKPFPCKRFNAKVTIKYGKPITKTMYGKTEEYLAHKLIVTIVRLPDDTWETVNVSAVASKKAVWSTTTYRIATSIIEDIDMNPDIKKTVANAKRLVVENCRNH